MQLYRLLHLLDGPQVDLQRVSGHLAGGLEQRVLPAQLLRHALDLQLELFGAAALQLV
jgi:hypothetical protein